MDLQRYFLASLITGGGSIERPAASLLRRDASIMKVLELLVVPAAFTLVNTMFLFAGRIKPLSEVGVQTAGGLRVAAFVLCTLFAVAFAAPFG